MGKLITWKHRLTWVGACVGQLPTTGSLGEIPLMTVSRWESKSSYLKLPKPIGWRCYWKWNSFVSEEDLWYGQNAIFKFYFCVESESRASQMLSKHVCSITELHPHPRMQVFITINQEKKRKSIMCSKHIHCMPPLI